MGDGYLSAASKAVGPRMVLFVFAALLAATVLMVGVVARVVNQGCRYRCTCVADSTALGALASIVENTRFGHGR
jgi:hypothetical protein